MSDTLTPEDIAKLPQQYRYVRDHIGQSQMQAIVAAGAIGGLFIGKMIFDAYSEPVEGETDDEREARENVPKFLGGALLAGGLFYALDIDSKWWSAESASVEAEKWLDQNANFF